MSRLYQAMKSSAGRRESQRPSVASGEDGERSQTPTAALESNVLFIQEPPTDRRGRGDDSVWQVGRPLLSRAAGLAQRRSTPS